MLAAAREEITARLKEVPPPPQDKTMNDPYKSKREELEASLKRITGNWHWVVTRSHVVNAFVTPFCPRRVFVNEGLLLK